MSMQLWCNFLHCVCFYKVTEMYVGYGNQFDVVTVWFFCFTVRYQFVLFN